MYLRRLLLPTCPTIDGVRPDSVGVCLLPSRVYHSFNIMIRDLFESLSQEKIMRHVLARLSFVDIWCTKRDVIQI